MADNNTVWNTIFSRDGRVFTQPNEDMPAFAEKLRVQKAKKVLDLGCGTGRHLVYFAEAGFEVYGIDQAPRALELARQWLHEAGLQADLRQGDMIDPLPYPDSFFDGVISIAVIHHTVLAKIKAIIAEMHRVLKPGGLVFVSVPWKDRQDEDHPANEIEPDTFIPLEGSEKGLPHHMFTDETLREAFGNFNILETHLSSRKYHICITAKKTV
jgi:tellurite methyltransferase